VVAAEHTGLLVGQEREALQIRFKDQHPKPWYENLLSATPTLEMGVDIGDLSSDGKPTLHPHVVVSRADGIAMGGHLLEAHVRPTLEVVLTESPRHLHKRKDAESGLALIAADE
jgi:predicted DNA-binding protein with PD1-like motif